MSSTVVAGMMGALVAVALVPIAASTQLSRLHEARNSVDAAALAAASHQLEHPERDPCSAAERLTQMATITLQSCHCDQLDCHVVGSISLWGVTLHPKARAGTE